LISRALAASISSAMPSSAAFLGALSALAMRRLATRARTPTSVM